MASSSLNALEDIEPFLSDDVECIGADTVRAVGKQAYLSQAGEELYSYTYKYTYIHTSNIHDIKINTHTFAHARLCSYIRIFMFIHTHMLVHNQ